MTQENSLSNRLLILLLFGGDKWLNQSKSCAND
ncbi:Uncharacterised protein [Vibrio cholerae]|nr:Uncharacterised protein [Vibrio cholerae]